MWTTDQHKTGQLIYRFPRNSWVSFNILWIYSKLRRINISVEWISVSLLEEINLQISIGDDSWLIMQRLKPTVFPLEIWEKKTWSDIQLRINFFTDVGGIFDILQLWLRNINLQFSIGSNSWLSGKRLINCFPVRI